MIIFTNCQLDQVCKVIRLDKCPVQFLSTSIALAWNFYTYRDSAAVTIAVGKYIQHRVESHQFTVMTIYLPDAPSNRLRGQQLVHLALASYPGPKRAWCTLRMRSIALEFQGVRILSVTRPCTNDILYCRER